MRRYVTGFVRYLLFYLAGFIIFYLMSYCVNAVLTLLSEELPKLFVIENPIKDREAYDNQQLNLAFISGIITLYIVTNLAVKYDNERFEHVVEKTEGFYTLRDGYALYARRYILPDFIISIIVPFSTFGFAFINIPEDAKRIFLRLGDYAEVFIALQRAFTERLGFAFGFAFLIFLSLLFRIPTGFFAVKRFRGIWLADTEG